MSRGSLRKFKIMPRKGHMSQGSQQVEEKRMDEALCVSVQTAARMLGISRNTGYLMVKLGQLPVIRCGERRLVVPLAALQEMLRGEGQTTKQEQE